MTNPDTIDIHLGEPPENFEPDCTDPRWVLTVTCGDQMNVTTFSKLMANAFPETVQWLTEKAVARIRGEHENVRLGREVADLTRWKAEALEVLNRWNACHIAAGEPGRLGEDITIATRDWIERATLELAEFKQWASDACELLHELHTRCYNTENVFPVDRVLALLRRMETRP